jgi:ubiquinone/menaquinone biosynthesis C-methylase UbiE
VREQYGDASRLEARARLPGAHLAGARVERLPLADGASDVAVASHVLYHVPDRAAALAELHRVLRR